MQNADVGHENGSFKSNAQDSLRLPLPTAHPTLSMHSSARAIVLQERPSHGPVLRLFYCRALRRCDHSTMEYIAARPNWYGAYVVLAASCALTGRVDQRRYANGPRLLVATGIAPRTHHRLNRSNVTYGLRDDAGKIGAPSGIATGGRSFSSRGVTPATESKQPIALGCSALIAAQGSPCEFRTCGCRDRRSRLIAPHLRLARGLLSIPIRARGFSQGNCHKTHHLS